MLNNQTESLGNVINQQASVQRQNLMSVINNFGMNRPSESEAGRQMAADYNTTSGVHV